jgi:hypothetical protein
MPRRPRDSSKLAEPRGNDDEDDAGDSSGSDFAAGNFDSDQSGVDSDVAQRRRRRKAHRREREADGMLGNEGDEYGEEGDGAERVAGIATDDSDEAETPQPEDRIAPSAAIQDVKPSAAAEAPHIQALLSVMLPAETVHSTLARLGQAKQNEKNPEKAAAISANLAKAMAAAGELMSAFGDNDVHEATRDALVARCFRALRKKLPPCFVLRWGTDAEPPLPTAEKSAVELGWLGPFEADQMESWRVANIFTRKAAHVWDINAVPRAKPKLATDVATFK